MKRDRTIYWILTTLVALGFAMSSFMYLSRSAELMQGFQQLGYPEYFVTLLGVAKLVGAIALLNPWWNKIKEWAYAGFIFVLVGAIWTHTATKTPVVAPVMFLVLTSLSYWFYRRAQVHKVPALVRN